MTKTIKTIISGLMLAAAVAAPVNAGDATRQTFVFMADAASDNPALDTSIAERLANKVLIDARSKGFNYGDQVILMSEPGGNNAWDQRFTILKSQNTHPEQLASFLTRKLGELSRGRLHDNSPVMWALESAGQTLDCTKEETFVYVFLNGASAGNATDKGFGGDGTSPEVLKSCNLVWVGLSINSADLSPKARRGLIPFFQVVATNAGASHASIQ